MNTIPNDLSARKHCSRTSPRRRCRLRWPTRRTNEADFRCWHETDTAPATVDVSYPGVKRTSRSRDAKSAFGPEADVTDPARRSGEMSPLRMRQLSAKRTTLCDCRRCHAKLPSGRRFFHVTVARALRSPMETTSKSCLASCSPRLEPIIGFSVDHQARDEVV